MNSKTFVVCVFVVLSFVSFSSAGILYVTVQDMGVGSGSQINGAGDISGVSVDPSSAPYFNMLTPFRTTSSGVRLDLSPDLFGNNYSAPDDSLSAYPSALDDHGTMWGHAYQSRLPYDIGTWKYSDADGFSIFSTDYSVTGTNSNGDRLSGWSKNLITGRDQPLLIQPGIGVTIFPQLKGDTHAQAISRNGQFLAGDDLRGSAAQGFMIDLNTNAMTVFTFNGFTTFVRGVNDFGNIVGDTFPAGGMAYFRDAVTGVITVLPHFTYGPRHEIVGSGATGISNDGIIVGWDVHPDDTRSDYLTSEAVMWRNGREYVLKDIDNIFKFDGAVAINNNNQILANGRDASGQNHVLVLTLTTSTPEPSSILLLGIGAIGAFFLHRRSRKS